MSSSRSRRFSVLDYTSKEALVNSKLNPFGGMVHSLSVGSIPEKPLHFGEDDDGKAKVRKVKRPVKWKKVESRLNVPAYPIFKTNETVSKTDMTAQNSDKRKMTLSQGRNHSKQLKEMKRLDQKQAYLKRLQYLMKVPSSVKVDATLKFQINSKSSFG